MTRLEYITAIEAIDVQMSDSHNNEKMEIRRTVDEYDLRLQEHLEDFHRQRQRIFDERDMKKRDIHENYKKIRRKLWTEHVELTHLWRSQLAEPAETETLEGGEE